LANEQCYGYFSDRFAINLVHGKQLLFFVKQGKTSRKKINEHFSMLFSQKKTSLIFLEILPRLQKKNEKSFPIKSNE
jgi:hypothetical protein